MPSISKIRFTNVVYEGGNKRYNDETFLFEGHNGAILLENGGGKTVLIQTILQAILPHVDLADRKIKDTLKLEDAPAHIGVEWILNEHPRRYALTCVSLFLTKNGLDSYRYVYDYGENDPQRIEEVPFVKPFSDKTRAADRGEIQEYYSHMVQSHMNAQTFDTIKDYKKYLEENFHIIAKEWESIVKINSAEGGVENFFDECKTTGQLFDRLLIPTVEESMTGFQKDEFAETFEKHRDGFKKYKQLKEKIAENKRIKENVEVYVNIFANLDEKQRDYQGIKEIAKAYTLLAKEQQAMILEENQQHNLSLEALKQKQNVLEQKESSYEIAVEQEKLALISKQLEVETEQQTILQEKLNETESHYYSLKLAENKKNRLIQEQTKKYNEMKLQELDQEFDTEEIRERLELNAREIKGYFVDLEENFKKEQQSLQYELNAVTNRTKLEQEALLKVEQEHRKLLDLETEKNLMITNNHQEMEKLQSSILSNPQQEKVEEELPKWISMHHELDVENTELLNRNKEILRENEELTFQLNTVQETLKEQHKEEATLSARKRTFDHEHQNLKSKLAQQKTIWSRMESLYLKQDSIEKQMIENIHKLSMDRDKLLEQERIAFRFDDDYGNQDVFYADPFLSEQLQRWKQQFSYLESGVSYIQSLPKSETYCIEQYPLWAITLVTTSKEKEKVLEKIKSVLDFIQFPVHVISLDEATEIVQSGTPIYSQWIQPRHWVMNIDEDSFLHWKEIVLQRAQEVKRNRLEKESEWQLWRQLQSDVYQFFHQFPYADYQEITDQLAEVTDRIFHHTAQEKKLKDKSRELDHEYRINVKKQNDNKDIMFGYETKMDGGNRFIQLRKDNEHLAIELLNVIEKREKLDNQISIQKKAIVDDQETINKLQQDVNEIEVKVSLMGQDRLYQKVKTEHPLFSSTTIEVLEVTRNNLQLELKNLSKGRSELEAAINYADQTIERMSREMGQLRKEHSYLNEALDYPANGAEKMNELWSNREGYATTLKIMLEKVRRLTSEYDGLEGAIKSMIKKVEKVIVFDGRLEFVRKELDQEKKVIQSQYKQLTQMIQQVEKQLEAIRTVVIKLEKYDPKHQYLEASIQERVLSNEEIMEFSYSGKKQVDEIVNGLETKLNALEKERDNVNWTKAKFIDFCRRDIKDVRMREMAIQGIENKVTYEEVLTYKELLEGRIQTAIKYAEQNMIIHDQELEQFIIHIHTHLKKITDELKVIPMKTKVKVEDDWKQIFLFNIPEWDEQEGKSSIREYIDWILNQLEKDVYKDENGHDDMGKIKRDLEKWLQSKQLLQVVMKNQTMKVTCRKVTNDNKVTKGTYSWEQSNVWSGGEKWSKNMTLFLGLLNYVAEKRKHIPQQLKRHRTVIVDNPFGKASSDHVLNPVFFIAEQLGFQIIALTAHAEGKFLRDYFPVIYSCRLRNAAGSEKQIMTKEKTVQHAYFIDHDPKALERLGEVEQKELF